MYKPVQKGFIGFRVEGLGLVFWIHSYPSTLVATVLHGKPDSD